MNIDELTEMLEEEFCQECRAPLTEEEREQGYVCGKCIREWLDEAVPA